MWIERIDEKTVKCFLTNDELKEYDVSYKDFIQRNEKARALMQEIIEMATEEVGYQPPRFSFDLQITMMPTEGMLLTFSEKDPQEELSDLIAHGMGTKERGLLGQLWDSVRHMLEESDDKDLADIARLGGLDTDDETGANGMDQIGTGKLTSGTAGLGNAGSGNVGSGNAEAGKAGSKKTGSGNAGSGKAGSAKTRSGSAQSDRDNPDAADVGLAVFSFRGMRDLGTFARALPDNLKMRSSLYAWDGGYLLLLEMGEESYEIYSHTCVQALEFGELYTAEQGRAAWLMEHGDRLIREDALQKLKLM